MKFSKSASIIAALAMATTAGLALSQQQADASTVATVTTKGPATLYDINGKEITNRALAPNTQWAVGKIYVFNSQSAIYQVSTHEYLKSSEANLSGDFAYLQPTGKATKLVGTIKNGNAPLYRDDTKTMSNRQLANGTSWALGKHYINKNGEHYFQVSTHEYANSDQLTLNHLPDTTVYSADFGIVSGSNHVSTPNNSNNNLEVNNNNNSSNTTNNNTGNTTNVTPNKPTTPTNTGSYKPNLANINRYFVAYLNALHKANGTAAVNSTADMISYAQQRAGQQTATSLDHTTATRETSENLSTAGFNYMNYAGVKSDKDAAYFLLKSWYDEANNYTAPGAPGHYGHRAALIYSGPTVGLGITSTDASFDADWNDDTLDQFNQLYDYTGSNPNTKFISKDAI